MNNILYLSLISLLSTVQGSSFKPNCTLPPTGTNYVSGPNTRGTISILWNCLSIIFLCTWSIQHLNIPAMRPETDSTWQKIKWAILDSRTKVKWMIFTVLVPEYMIGKALNEMIAVYYRTRNDYPSFSRDKVSSHMANMGYFVLDLGDYWLESRNNGNRMVEEEPPQYESVSKSSACQRRDAEPGYSLKVKVEELLRSDDYSASMKFNLSRMAHEYWALSSTQLDWVIPSILDLPTVPVRHMEVLNRGNFLVKALALVQITYLIVQLVVREIAGLPSAQLEIGALAFSVCSIMTYILYWNRPQGIESIHIMKPKCAPSIVRILQVAQLGPSFMWTKFRHEHESDKLYDLAPIPNDGLSLVNSLLFFNIFGLNGEILILAAGGLLGGTLFGGLHCLAWNFHFPTSGEALAWRICSCLTSALPLISVVPLNIWLQWHPWQEKSRKSPVARFVLGSTIILLFLVPYVLARLFLIFEMFRSLFFLPREAFVDTWSGSFPHWG